MGAQGSSVVVIGGANLDIMARPSGQLVSGTSNPGLVSLSAGGVARNIADNLARLGVPVSLITAIGRDEPGDKLRRETEAAGVDVSMVLALDRPTGVYCAVLDRDGELAVGVNRMDVIDGLTAERLAPHQGRIGAAGILIADCNLPLDTLDWLCGLTTRTGARLIIETVSVAKSAKLAHLLERGRRIYLATPNRLQAEALTGMPIAAPFDVVRVAGRLKEMGLDNVIITLGEEGAFLACTAGSVMVPPFPARSVDVTGAGDAATAGIVFALARGWGLAEAMHVGQAAAKLTVESAASVCPAISREAVLALAARRLSIPVR